MVSCGEQGAMMNGHEPRAETGSASERKVIAPPWQTVALSSGAIRNTCGVTDSDS